MFMLACFQTSKIDTSHLPSHGLQADLSAGKQMFGCKDRQDGQESL